MLEAQIYVTNSAEETTALGMRLSAELADVSVVALYGDMGAGKTAFSAGIARGLNCRQTASSPTYTIVNEYYGDRRVCHFDMYRINDPEQLYEIGWEEYIDSGALCIVEWSENIEEAIPDRAWHIYIEKTDENSRRIRVVKC